MRLTSGTRLGPYGWSAHAGDAQWRICRVAIAGQPMGVLHEGRQSGQQSLENAGWRRRRVPGSRVGRLLQLRGCRALAHVGRSSFGFTVSPDRKWVLYTQTNPEGSDLSLVENFR